PHTVSNTKISLSLYSHSSCITIPQSPRSTLFPYTTLFRSREINRAVFAPAQQKTMVRLVGIHVIPYNVTASIDPKGVGKGSELRDRKSTRLNSSHGSISYAVFCLKKIRDSSHVTYLLITTT